MIFLKFSNLLYCILGEKDRYPEEILQHLFMIEFLFYRKFNHKLTDFNVSIYKKNNLFKLITTLELDINICPYGELNLDHHEISLKYLIHNDKEINIVEYIKNSNYNIEEIIYLERLIHKLKDTKYSYLNFIHFFNKYILGKEIISNLSSINNIEELSRLDVISEKQKIIKFAS